MGREITSFNNILCFVKVNDNDDDDDEDDMITRINSSKIQQSEYLHGICKSIT